jgi:hypothetical protein
VLVLALPLFSLQEGPPELRGLVLRWVGPHEPTYGSLRGGPEALLWYRIVLVMADVAS